MYMYMYICIINIYIYIYARVCHDICVFVCLYAHMYVEHVYGNSQMCRFLPAHVHDPTTDPIALG